MFDNDCKEQCQSPPVKSIMVGMRPEYSQLGCLESRREAGDLSSPFTAILSVARLESSEIQCAFAGSLQRWKVQRKIANRVDFMEESGSVCQRGQQGGKIAGGGQAAGSLCHQWTWRGRPDSLVCNCVREGATGGEGGNIVAPANRVRTFMPSPDSAGRSRRS